MKGFVIGTVVTAIAFYVLTTFLPQFVEYKGELIGLLGIAVIFGLVNGFIGPVVKIGALPLTFMTMGLIGFVINAALLLLTGVIADQAGFNLTIGDFPPDFTADTILAAIIGAVVLSVVGAGVRMVVPD